MKDFFYSVCLVLPFFLFPGITTTGQTIDELSPLQIARLVGDRIVDNTRFEFNYVLQPKSTDAEIIDFGESLGKCEPGVAYALSNMFSEVEQQEIIQIGHTDGVKVWMNDELVYEKKGDRDFPIAFGEVSYLLPESFPVKFKKGKNKILVKSECREGAEKWLVILQSKNLSRYAAKGMKIECSLKELASDISITNWLILGPFENQVSGTVRLGLDKVLEPENSIVFHKIYESGGKKFAWNIPRINLVTSNPGGGKFYYWIYHVGSTMWGLQKLSQMTDNPKYNDYVAKWCSYTLSTIPIVEYQKNTLHAFLSMNWSLIQRPMLDYTTAPAMPFLTRLVYENDFEDRERYVEFVEPLIDYAMNRQFRMPNGVFAREYTIDQTVWADDMFMGLPWLLYSARYTKDPSMKRKLHDDVVNQVTQFRNYLYDTNENLYRQAIYPDKPELKVPFWSRGNGWAVWAESEVLLNLPKSHPGYKKMLSYFRSHIDGIVNYQDTEGFWHNLLNVPKTVRESSGTAMFTMAIARGINEGWLNDKKYRPYALKGWGALKTFLDENGDLHGVKGGTHFSTDPEDYERTPLRTSDTHGILPLLFTCFEMEKLLNK